MTAEEYHKETSPSKKGPSKNDHTPSFLNTLKKNKEKELLQEFTKSAVGKYGRIKTQ